MRGDQRFWWGMVWTAKDACSLPRLQSVGIAVCFTVLWCQMITYHFHLSHFRKKIIHIHTQRHVITHYASGWHTWCVTWHAMWGRAWAGGGVPVYVYGVIHRLGKLKCKPLYSNDPTHDSYGLWATIVCVYHSTSLLIVYIYRYDREI